MHIRLITDDELVACERLKAGIFGLEFTPERFESVRPIREVDRTFAAFDGTVPVATLSAMSFEMTVPGARVPAAGISGLAIAPDYASKALEDGLFAAELRAARERGEPLAALCALADMSIGYGKYGFAVASYGVDWVLRPPWPEFPAEPDIDVSSANEVALPLICAVYDMVRVEVPGTVDRSPAQWERWRSRHGGADLVLAVSDGACGGYAITRTQRGVVSVIELVAVTAASYRALMRHIFSAVDVAEVHAEHRPLLDPAICLVPIPLRAKRTVTDGVWIRILDVAAALATRRYSRPVRVTLAVTDDILPGNVGSFLLEGDHSAASCLPVDRAADVRTTIGALGAAYLGGVPFSVLSRAGLAEGPSGLLSELDAAFGWEAEPWAITRF